MTIYTRLGEEGYGVRRLSSFAGKTPDTGAGPHPVTIITRLSLDGYGVRRYSSFAGKTPDTGGSAGPHPVTIITRLSLDGYGVRRYSSFAGKTLSTAVVVTSGRWPQQQVKPKKPIQTASVDSSLIDSMSYDEKSRELKVTFKTTDETYSYANAPPKAFSNIQRAKSSGKYFLNNVKGKYFHQKTTK